MMNVIQLQREHFLKNTTDFFLFNGEANMTNIYQGCYKSMFEVQTLLKEMPNTLEAAEEYLHNL